MDIAKYGIAIDARQVKDAEKALDGMGAAGARAEKSLGGMSAQAKIAGGVLGTVLAASATVAAKSLLSAQIEADKLANTLKFATGANNLRAELEFTRKTAETLGLELISSSQAYAKLAAAAKDTALEGKATRDIFTAVGKASTVMGLSASESQGALLAISQMMSKGTVQAEELRGQLGERIPGAFQMAARAMGVTTSELSKMLEQGQVMAEDFLPKLAAELERTLGDQAGSAAMSAQSGLNKLANEWTLLKQAMAGTEEWKNTSGWMIESTTNWVKNLRAAVEQGDWFDKLQWLTTGRVSGETAMKAQGRRFIGGIEQIVPPEPAKAAQYKQPELTSQDRQLLDGLRTAQEKAADTRGQLYNLLVQDKISLDEYNKRLAALMEKGAKKGSAGGDRITDYQRLIESSRERIAVLQAELGSETKLTEGEKYAAKMLADVRSGKLKLTAAEREHLEAMAGAIGQMSRYQAQQAEQAEGVKRLADEERKRNEELQASVKHDQDALGALKIRTDLMMLGVTATEDITVAMLEAQLASKDFTTATYEEIDALERRIGIAREAAQVAREGRRYESQQRAAKDAAQTAAREWERASDQIAQSLADNIMRGGKSAGELLQDYFRTLVLRPIIQGTVQAGMNAVFGGSGPGSILQTGSNLLGLTGGGFGSLGTMTSYGTAAATGGLLGGASQGAMLAAQTAEFGMAGATATAEALGGVASSLGAVSAALGPIGIGLGVLAMGGLFDDEGDAQRSGNWVAKLGERGGSPNNHWFSGAEMNATLDAFAQSVADVEAGIIKNLGLSADQISTIDAEMSKLSAKEYGFGMEHTDWTQSMADEQIVADRMKVIADALGMTVEQLAAEMALTNEALRATFDASVLSDAEKLAVKTQSVRDGFAALNLSMPETVEQYQAMVEGSSGALERSLLKLAPAFVEVTRAAEQATVAQEQATVAQEQAAAQAREQATQAAMGGLSAAFEQLNAAVEAERAGIAKAHTAQVESVNAQIAASDRLTRRLEPLSSVLHSTLTNLREGLAGAAMSRQQAQAQISAAVAIARAGGALPEASELQNALSIVSKPSEGLFKTFHEYQRDQYLTAIDVADLVELTDAQLTDAQRQTAAMTAQLSVLEAGFAAENTRLDGILTLAQAQLNATMGNTTALLSVAEALAQFGGARVAVEATSSNPASQAVISAYQQLAGKSVGEIDTEGFDYWKQQAEQIGVEQMRADFANSVRAVRGYANGGTHSGGWRAVGETGMELEYTGASQIISNRDARDLLDMAPLLEEMRGMRVEMSAMRGDVAQTQRNTRRHVDLFEVTTEGGEAMRTVAA